MSQCLSHSDLRPYVALWKICCLLIFLASATTFPAGKASAQQRDFVPLQNNVKTLSTNLNGFGIPFKVTDQGGQFIEVQLYVSEDQGRTWSFHSRQPTSEREFPFTSDGDGEYWFAIKTLDRNRRLLPEGDARPELKIIVDSQKPELDFRIEADAAGRVVCRWQIRDADLDPESLEISYRASAGELPVDGKIYDQWNIVPVQLSRSIKGDTWSDQLAWWPDTLEQRLEVKLEVADRAGNLVTANRFVSVRPTTWRRKSSASTLKNSNSPFVSDTSNPVIEVQRQETSSWQPKLQPVIDETTRRSGLDKSQPVPSATTSSTDRWRINENTPLNNSVTLRSAALPPGVEIAAPPVPLDFVQTTQRPAFPSTPLNASSGDAIEWESEIHSKETSERSFVGSTMGPAPEIAPSSEPIASVTDSIPTNPSTRVRSGKNFITESTTSWPNNQWNGPPTTKYQPYSELAPGARKMVAINRENSEFADQPSPYRNAGFRKLPAVTQNKPSTSLLEDSSMMPESANTQIISTKRFQLNYDINAIDPSGVGRVDLWMTRDRGQTWKVWGQDPDHVSPFPVEVMEEGIYGFRIVVRSKDGLAGRGPMRGEEADMWVQVDVTAPLVKITSVPYGRSKEVGRLVINYAVSDSNLALRPNTLQWSTNPDGPWTAIEEDLRNEGRYVWKPAQNVPHRIFLRLESVDRAGNAGVHLLEQAIDISGLVPRGTIFGVDPVGN